MTRAVDHTGVIQKRVKAWIQQRKAAPTSTEEFRRHPRVQWKAGEVKQAAALPAPKKTPANERERQAQYGGCYAMCEIAFASVNNYRFAELSERDGERG